MNDVLQPWFSAHLVAVRKNTRRNSKGSIPGKGKKPEIVMLKRVLQVHQEQKQPRHKTRSGRARVQMMGFFVTALLHHCVHMRFVRCCSE